MSDQVAGSGPAGTNGKAAPKNVVDIKDERAKRWKDKLYRTEGKSPRIKNVVANGLVALRGAPEWKDALRFDENAQKVQLEKLPPDPWPQSNFIIRHWNDQDDTLLSEWLTRYGIDLSSSAASEAALTVARESSFHPIRLYLQSLKWDGVPRVDKWLTTYLGADDVGDTGEYHSAIGKRWLISGVARIMKPGCQVDHVLIFEGLQGNGKSSLLRELCSLEDWFTDQSPNLDDKHTPMAFEGKWIVELAELETFKGQNHERLKAFITRRTDRIKRPWGRHFIDLPRQSIFAGSTNKDDYFNDETGNRRYWPFKATKLDIAGIKTDRDQLWAEAVTLYNNKFPHWLETPALRKLACEAQDQRFDTDPWEEDIDIFVDGVTEVVTKVVARHVIPEREITRADTMRVAKILRHLGFVRTTQRNAKGKPYKVFIRLES